MNDAPAGNRNETAYVAAWIKAPEWRHPLASRLGAYWYLKLAGIPAFIAVFFVAYFWTLESALFPVTTMPATLFDHLITFRAEALPLYLSLWIYVSLPPSLLDDRRELFSYGFVAGALAVVGLGIFLLCPTDISRPDIDWSLYPAFAPLKGHNASGNACPSLHAAFAVFSAIWLDRIVRRMGRHPVIRILNACWCVGILYSTLATKQHVALDLVAGSALGVAGAALKLRRTTPAPA
jgi:membrane-associated phospholipid phosphatase